MPIKGQGLARNKKSQSLEKGRKRHACALGGKKADDRLWPGTITKDK